MMVLALAGGLLLGTAFVLREIQLSHERSRHAMALARLVGELNATRKQVRRVWEDLFVLRTVLLERHVLSEGELFKGRIRLIEKPSQIAQERDAFVQGRECTNAQLVVDDSETIH